jgi:hypothetical protein
MRGQPGAARRAWTRGADAAGVCASSIGRRWFAVAGAGGARGESEVARGSGDERPPRLKPRCVGGRRAWSRRGTMTVPIPRSQHSGPIRKAHM